MPTTLWAAVVWHFRFPQVRSAFMHEKRSRDFKNWQPLSEDSLLASISIRWVFSFW